MSFDGKNSLIDPTERSNYYHSNWSLRNCTVTISADLVHTPRQEKEIPTTFLLTPLAMARRGILPKWLPSHSHFAEHSQRHTVLLIPPIIKQLFLLDISHELLT